METVALLDIDQIKTYVALQLAGAALGQKGMISVRQLFSNIKRYTDTDMDYPSFLSALGELRGEYQMRDGDIGVDVNYIALK